VEMHLYAQGGMLSGCGVRRFRSRMASVGGDVAGDDGMISDRASEIAIGDSAERLQNAFKAALAYYETGSSGWLGLASR